MQSFLSDYVGLKEPSPKLKSDPAYGFYGWKQALGLPPMGNDDPPDFWAHIRLRRGIIVNLVNNSGIWLVQRFGLSHPELCTKSKILLGG